MPEALIASLALAVVTTLIVGIVPAWNASRQDLANGMKESGKGAGAGHKHGWIRQGLVVAEVALSLVLLLGAGLLIRSFATLVSTDLGVDPAGIAAVFPRFEHRDTPDIAAASPVLLGGSGARPDRPWRHRGGPGVHLAIRRLADGGRRGPASSLRPALAG